MGWEYIGVAWEFRCSECGSIFSVYTEDEEPDFECNCKNMENYFNKENTSGFDTIELDLMNKDLENRMSDYDSNSFEYNDILKREAEKVLRDWE